MTLTPAAGNSLNQSLAVCELQVHADPCKKVTPEKLSRRIIKLTNKLYEDEATADLAYALEDVALDFSIRDIPAAIKGLEKCAKKYERKLGTSICAGIIGLAKTLPPQKVIV